MNHKFLFSFFKISPMSSTSTPMSTAANPSLRTASEGVNAADHAAPHFGLIGLGKMGANMVRRLAIQGIRVAVFDQDAAVTNALAAEVNAVACTSLADMVSQLAAPRVLWMMLPSGAVTESTLDQLQDLATLGDTLVDGANSNYKDSVRRAAQAQKRGFHYMDAGVSGGVHGLANGYCLMVGGSAAALQAVQPYLEILAPAANTGWLHAGPAGAGHFTKMIHNGIEYGMMAALAEGLSLLKAKKDFDIDLADVTELWRHGSVVRSWLLDLTAQTLQADQSLDHIKAHVPDSGEGRWTANESIELGVPTPVMTLALMSRFASQGSDDYASKLLAKMRQGFGGHAVGTV
jgi:6-phosphogluconate dehydrogenase